MKQSFFAILSIFLAMAGRLTVLWGSDGSELRERAERAVDRLEAEGELELADLEMLREASLSPESHCALFELWLDEPFCESTAEEKAPSSGKSERGKIGGTVRSDGTHREEIRWTVGEPHASFGRVDAGWQGSPIDAPWKERSMTWEFSRWGVRGGEIDSPVPIGRGGFRRSDRTSVGTDFLYPGGTLPNGLSLRWSPKTKVWGEATMVEDRYKTGDGDRFGRLRWEGVLRGESERRLEKWWIGGGGERSSPDQKRFDPSVWWGWKSGSILLWSGWSPRGESSDSERGAEQVFAPSAVVSVIGTDRHRLELSAAGKRWGTSEWKIPGATAERETGYWLSRGPFFSVAGKSERTGELWRGTAQWNSRQSGESLRWKTILSLRRNASGWTPGASLSLSGHDSRGSHWLRAEGLVPLSSRGWTLVRLGPAWGVQIEEEALSGEEWLWGDSMVRWPMEWIWKAPFFQWKIKWPDLSESVQTLILFHRMSWKLAPNGAGHRIEWGGELRLPWGDAPGGSEFRIDCTVRIASASSPKLASTRP